MEKVIVFEGFVTLVTVWENDVMKEIFIIELKKKLLEKKIF